MASRFCLPLIVPYFVFVSFSVLAAEKTETTQTSSSTSVNASSGNQSRPTETPSATTTTSNTSVNASMEDQYDEYYYSNESAPCSETRRVALWKNRTVPLGCEGECGRRSDGLDFLCFNTTANMSALSPGDNFTCGIGTCRNHTCVINETNQICTEIEIWDDYDYIISAPCTETRYMISWKNSSGENHTVPVGCNGHCGEYDNQICANVTGNVSSLPPLQTILCGIGKCINKTCVVNLKNETCREVASTWTTDNQSATSHPTSTEVNNVDEEESGSEEEEEAPEEESEEEEQQQPKEDEEVDEEDEEDQEEEDDDDDEDDDEDEEDDDKDDEEEEEEEEDDDDDDE